MDYESALAYMNGRLRLGWKLGNARFLALLSRLGDPQEQLKVVHIAGTKGKGSTTAMAASILQVAGYSVGLYLSPYVYDVRERIQVNGVMISQNDFARWVTQIKPHIEALEQTELGPTTEFELKTAVGLCYFAEQRTDYVALEVGVGGRLDATNVIAQPLVTAITNIGFDHMEMLGNTLAEIATEKAGIVKPNIPCVTGVEIGGEADAVIRRICAEREAPLSHVAAGRRDEPRDTYYKTAFDGTLTVATPRRSLRGLTVRLRGLFQHANAALAISALDAVSEVRLPPVSDEAIRQGLATAFVPGRLEVVAIQPTVILDGAHNELAAQTLAEALKQEFGADRKRLILVVGLSKNHDPESFLAPLAALKPAALIATQPSFRPRDAAEVAAAAQKYDIPQVSLVETSAVDAARAALALAGSDDILCITGSFFTVGDVPPTFWSGLLTERNQ